MGDRFDGMRQYKACGAGSWDEDDVIALLEERDGLLEALAGLIDACQTVNEAQGRQVVDAHELYIAESAIARTEGRQGGE